MTSGSMCRVCLVGNIRLLNLSAIHREVYEKLTNTELNAEIEYGMPSTVCYICHRQLQRCHAFSEMARKSNRILQEVLHNSTQVSHRAERIQHVQVMPTLTMSRTHHTSVDNAGYAEVEVVVKEERLLAVDNEPVEHLDIDIEECKLEPPDIKVEIEDDAIETKPMLERDMRPNYKRSCFYCDVCNKEMCRKSDLVKHILKFHNGKNPYSCAECDKIYSSKSALTKHERVHSGEKPYSCNICCKTFVVQDSLTRHMLIHTGEKPFSCNRCNNTFTFKTNLARHMRGHTGEKPYSCTECGKIFTENGSLTKHMRVHTGEKPYSCNKCHQTFTQKGNVKRHMRIHTGEKPYSCSKCDKIFTDKGNLTRHLRVHISSNFETSPPMLVHIDATDGTPVPNTI